MRRFIYRFRNFFQIPFILFVLIRNVNRQKRFLKKHIHPLLAEAVESNDGSLDTEDFKKITHYYGLAVPAILGEALCALRGRNMTLQERLALTFQGAMTGLGDDLFDKQDLPDPLIKTLIENPDKLTGNNSAEKLFLLFYRKSIQHAHDPAMMLRYLHEVFEAQTESRKQGVRGTLPEDEIVRITVEKGAQSVLFYRSVLTNTLHPAEEKALYQMGGLMQLGNDIFDVYKDCLKKIDTPVTTSESVQAIRELFSSQMEKSFSLFCSTAFPRRNIDRFLRLIYLSLCSRCFVCLDQLERKEKETQMPFSPCAYERKELVCDMEKAGNKWKTILKYVHQPEKKNY